MLICFYLHIRYAEQSCAVLFLSVHFSGFMFVYLCKLRSDQKLK